MRRDFEDMDAAPLARFLARYSPQGALPVDMAFALNNARHARPGILTERADKEEKDQ